MNYSELNDSELIDKINECYKSARQHSSTWRKENSELHRFRSGHQWSDDEKAILEEQGRPPVVFNRAGTIIDAVVGNEIANRQEIRFLPRTADDASFNEIATETIRWVRQECNAEDEESDAFENVLIGGMGWIETRVDYDENGEPIIVMEAVDPQEMFWDTNSRKHNLEDRKWQCREKWIPMDEAKAMWPNVEELKPSEGMAPELDDDIRNADPPYYERESSGFDKKNKTVRVLEYEWIEHEVSFVVENPVTGSVERDVSPETLKKLEKKFPNLNYSRVKKPRCYRAYSIGQTLLERGDGPKKTGFNYECITGKRDSKNNTFYGLMRGVKDPQEWANKFFSQILHIINSNSKGGFFWEEGALVNEQVAKEDLARPDGMVKLKPGGLQKIKERQMFNFPASIDRMLEFAISSIRDVPGVNLELLGMSNRDQAGIVESQRSRQALTVLAPIFSNLRRYRKNQGKSLLYFVREYIPEGRLIRVVGEDGVKVIPLMKDPLTSEYDVIVEQSPTSPNSKTEAWVALRDVLPVLQAAGMQPPKEIVDVLPLPESMTAKWKEAIKAGPPPEIKQKMDEMGQAIQELQQENQILKNDQNTELMKIDVNHQHQMHSLELQRQRLAEEMNINMERLRSDSAMQMEKLNAEISLRREQMMAEIGMEREKISAEFELKREEKLNQTTTESVGQDAVEFRESIKQDIITTLPETLATTMNEELDRKNREMMEFVAKSIIESVKVVAETMNKPKVLVYDQSGNPIGSKPVESLN